MSGGYPRHRTASVDSDGLYDFLFENDHAAWFCNAVQRLVGDRDIKEFIMRLHTGESQSPVTPNWSWKQREKLGQQQLENLAEDLLQKLESGADQWWGGDEYRRRTANLNRALELDGYSYRDRQLRRPEEDVLDSQESRGVLHGLYADLGLENQELAFHHLSLSEEHYLAGRWDDAISNSRKFLECALQEVAARHSSAIEKRQLSAAVKESPGQIRQLLEGVGLIEVKEREALAKVYGLLSQTGGHPYMAQNDQARLLRHLALTFSQFVLLRLAGKLKGASG